MSTRLSLSVYILVTALVAGTLDIISACVQFVLITGQPFTKVLVFVASGFFGKEAFTGDPVTMMWWGLLFHYLIALTFTTIFFLIFPRIPELLRYPAASGLVYGILVWLIMNLLVIPLSQIPPRPFRLGNAVIGMLIIMVMIGLPIGLLAGRYYKRAGATKV
ncbi:DUF1440 domain-containing protein [Chitinophaga solisilvae]|uniref:DUF1440 domain-containing protein n=1 Tax=Chitinophaga solisilvae TaxID=1233460 RepID=UPI001369F97C|nr:DUF1440 domain-containing protein [Chitinophaga solisilvae]